MEMSINLEVKGDRQFMNEYNPVTGTVKRLL